MKQSLENPRHYPALSDSVFPGDRVAIALQNGIAHPEPILSSLLEPLWEANVAPADVVIVVSRRTAKQLGFSNDQLDQVVDPEGQGQPAIQHLELGGEQISIQIHHGEYDASVAYLMANEDGDAMHVNRLLVDADVILPVGCPTAGEDSRQVDCLYPEFGSAAVQERFRQGIGSQGARLNEIELANNTLGSFFSIQIVTGPGDEIRQIICGARDDVTREARAETNKLWEFECPGAVEVSVGTIETAPTDQTWDDFAQAVITASRVSAANAPIVIWSDIREKPNRRVRKACLSQFEEGISTRLSQEWQHMAAIINERPIYLKSQLTRNEVEQLGIGYIESVDEVIRISEPHASGLLLRDAHKCQPRH